ncbi:MarR family transcriptional regulator [Lachnospiraceae bacterium ZAX-1]
MALMAIIHLPKNETSLNAIAQKLGTTKQNAKQLISALEKKNVVVLKHNDNDKRAYVVEITKHGKAVISESNLRGLSFFSELFRDFSTEEMETLWNLMKKLYRYDGKEQDGFEENAILE